MSNNYSFKINEPIDGKFNILTTKSNSTKKAAITINSLTDGSDNNKCTVRMRLGDNPTDWTDSVSTSTLQIYQKSGIVTGSGFIQGVFIALSSTNISMLSISNAGSNYTANVSGTVSGGSGSATVSSITINGSGGITGFSFSNVSSYIAGETLTMSLIDINNTNASTADDILELGDDTNQLIIQKTNNQQIGSVSVISIALTPKTTSKNLLLGTNSKPITYVRTDNIQTTNGISTSSDERIKENIVNADLDTCLTNINNLQVRKYNYVNKTFHSDLVHGFIAQEVKKCYTRISYYY